MVKKYRRDVEEAVRQNQRVGSESPEEVDLHALSQSLHLVENRNKIRIAAVQNGRVVIAEKRMAEHIFRKSDVHPLCLSLFVGLLENDRGKMQRPERLVRGLDFWVISADARVLHHARGDLRDLRLQVAHFRPRTHARHPDEFVRLE